jgi:cytochrome b561
MTTRHLRPDLGFWEKADLPLVHLSTYASMLYHAIAGVFRGKASPKRYDHFIMTNVIRKFVSRTSDRQKQYVELPLGSLHRKFETARPMC